MKGMQVIVVGWKQIVCETACLLFILSPETRTLNGIALFLPVDDLLLLYTKQYSMKTLHCADAGFDCKGVIKGTSEEEILSQAAQHAREVHQVEVTPEMAAQLRTLIRDEKEEVTAS